MSLQVNNFLSWVEVKQLYVNDAGTWRSPRVQYVNDAGTWRPVFARGLIATLVAGTDGTYTGFSASPAFGSLSTRTMVLDSTLVSSLVYNSGASRTELTISGFGSDPGQSYIGLLSISGSNEMVGSGASFYSYLAGSALWGWINGVTITNGGTYTVIVAGGGS